MRYHHLRDWIRYDIPNHDDILCRIDPNAADVSYRPRFPLIGLNGVDLREKWAKVPEGYFGVTIYGVRLLYKFLTSFSLLVQTFRTTSVSIDSNS